VKLRSSRTAIETIAFTAKQLHDPHNAAYWSAAFKSIRSDVDRLQRFRDGSLHDAIVPDPLAIFPLHGSSLLVLAGRILGDTSSVHVFQPNRNASGTRWAWPPNVQPPLSNKFGTRVLRDATDETEACLLVSLTFAIQADRLPEPLVSTTATFAMPVIEIFVDAPSVACIAHPEDLVHLGRAIDSALQRLQDEWHVKKIHLLVGAPASACVKVGQKLQARHHADVQCYEATAVDKTFRPTIQITRTQAEHIPSGQSVNLNS
jgi:hypothetical protein